MAKLTVNHEKLYFDSLCRTQKGESVLSLIHATYQAKKNYKKSVQKGDVKADIAQRLESAYNLFKKDAGTYSGGINQFSSQYTIGHELCIWKNSDLDLTPLALKVAENYITIRDYFDIVFLNYFQPINNNVVHILFHLLEFMYQNNLSSISKDDMGKVYMKVGKSNDVGNINGAYNMLLASSYFKADTSGKELIYIGKASVDKLISRCDTTYIEKGYKVALAELGEEASYIKYLLDDHRIVKKNQPNDKSCSESELAEELKQLYDLYGTVGIHLFGIRRGSYIKSNKISVPNLCKLASISDNYKQEIGKGTRLANFVSEKEMYDELEKEAFDELEISEASIEIKFKEFIEGGYNAIYYGTPGCGKSYFVENTLLREVEEEFKFRTIFYLDYTHTDFVGQLMPIVDKEKRVDGTTEEKVTYRFIPGPFTLALEKAYLNPKEMVYLVIEEINRGNAASILGDLFQLLDREKKENRKRMPVGQSEYSINKTDLCNYLYDEKNIILPNNKIYIPSNLSLIGTMNTSDQNVSTLDTAFKRRWKMYKLNNEFDSGHPYSIKYVPGTEVSWKTFVEKINYRIVNDSSIGINTEDKQIGPFFMESMDLEVEKNKKNEQLQRVFAYKMFEYLWSNVAKYERGNWFKDNPRTLDNLVESYVSKGIDIFEGDLFNEKSDDVQMYSDNGGED